jgi:hypothetical protein
MLSLQTELLFICGLLSSGTRLRREMNSGTKLSSFICLSQWEGNIRATESEMTNIS